MPIYEFECARCEHKFESVEKMGTEHRECPKCRGYAKRVLSASNHQVKGYSARNGYSIVRGDR